ncbi:MAG TPA: PIG-L family deacetylase [Methanobacteriaceae archaeon]|nr:PIG-L family deacetylase [Methanobacteriaceae archaeon]
MVDKNNSQLKKSNRTTFIISGVFILAIISLLFYLSWSYEPQTTYENFPEFSAADRILIFAPHPDDETLGTAGIIQRAKEKNATILVVSMTDGSGSHGKDMFKNFLASSNSTANETLPELRHRELIAAVSALGLNQSEIIFLGYPDAGLKSMFEDYWDSPYQSSNDFNSFNQSPYNYSYQKNASFTGANVANNVKTIIKDFKPTIIFYPDDGDDHTDHLATSAFVRYAALEANYTGKNYTYLVHKGLKWPTPGSYIPRDNLLPPYEVLALDAKWMLLNLSSNEENIKLNGLNKYHSQLFLTNDYLKSFIRTNELFAVYPKIEIEEENGIDFSLGIMPNSTFQDIRMDTRTELLKPADDLSALGLAYDNNYLYIVLETADRIDNNLIHNFKLRMWNGTQFKRIDITVQNNKASYEIKANNSVQSDQSPGIISSDYYMVISIPLSLVKGEKVIMLSSNVVDSQNKEIDMIAWRDLYFPEEFSQT